MNLGDPELELIDPTPNIHTLFIHFDKLFFWTKLASRAVVRWSKRMYSCAGICSYEGRGGLCDIALSEPLLKLRPRKDLVETLLHEMIHAYLFVTCRDQDRDGHGPNFKAHMHRINNHAGLNITIYHDFHDEVKLYQTHWWRCDGPCQTKRPHFGIVRRSANRPPGKNDFWWADHKAKCGGTFIKIKEPEKTVKQKATTKVPPKSYPPITKYINNNNNNSILNKNIPTEIPSKPVLKESNNIPAKAMAKPKSNIHTFVSTKKDNIVFNPRPPTSTPFTGSGQTVSGGRSRTNSASAAETVRNIWANKQINTTPPPNGLKRPPTDNVANTNNHKNKPGNVYPPSKITKIDDYFKTKATSILKDVYGQDFQITQAKNSNKLVAVVKNLVSCPICNIKVQDDVINRHLDECLNKDVIEKLSKDTIQIVDAMPTTQPSSNKVPKLEMPKYKDTSTQPNNITNISIPEIPKYKEIKEVVKFKIENDDIKLEIPDSIDLSFIDELIDKNNKSRDTRNVTIREPEINPKASYKEVIDLIKPEKTVNSYFDRPMKLCLCCNKMTDKPLAEHLEECLQFNNSDGTKPDARPSTSAANDAIIIDDDEDIFDESMTMNATGTKTPCPCCLTMVEQINMNQHLDTCLQ